MPRATAVLIVALLALWLAPPAGAADDGLIGTFDTSGANALPNVTGIAASGSSVFVGDVGKGVFRYDYAGRRIGAFAPNMAKRPTGLAAGTDGDVYVVRERKVQRFGVNGILLGTLGAAAPAGQRIGAASGPIAVDDVGNAFVYDVDDTTIVSYDDAGAFRFRTEPLGNVSGIAVYRNGTRLYVASSSGESPALRAFDEAGKPVGDVAPLAGELGRALGVAVKPDGTIVVGNDSGAGNELVYASPSGAVLRRIALSAQPAQMTANCRGDVYVRLQSQSLSSPDSVARYGDPSQPAPPCGERRPHGPFGGAPAVVTAPDVRITYMEVTQGVQPTGCPGCDAGRRTLDYATDLQGVQLVANHRTIVRVYADVAGGASGGLGDVPMVLSGSVQRGTKFERLAPIQQPAAVVPGSGVATDEQRLSQTAAYTFEVPDGPMSQAVTRGPLTLRAQIAPAGIPGSPAQCSACLSNDSFTVSGIRARQGPHLTIFPLALMNGKEYPQFPSGQPAIDPGTDLGYNPYGADPIGAQSTGFRITHRILPGTIDLQHYRGWIDIKPGILDDPKLTPDERQDKILAKVAEWIDDHGAGNIVTFGVTSRSSEVRGAYASGDDIHGGIVKLDRPLTSLSHEVFHAMGRPHASACNTTPEGTEPWPRDEMGLLQGIGIDPLPGSGRGNGPFRLIGSTARASCNEPPGQPGSPCLGPIGQTLFFDIMSYCSGADEGTAWVSPHNWNAIAQADPGFTLSRGGRTYYDSPAEPTGIRVTAKAPLAGSGTAPRIVDTAPTSRPAPDAAGASTDYRFELLHASGAVVGEAPAVAGAAHSDDGVPMELALSGVLPANPTGARVVLKRGGAAVAAQERSANPPTLRFTGPRAGQRLGGRGSVTLRWTASDPDGGPLNAKVEYSVDGGRRWSQVFDGGNSNEAQLPSSALSASRRARVRVRIDDGFNGTSAESAVFVSLGAPPLVRVNAPTSAATQRQDAALLLDGEAFDDRDRPLTGKRLRWFAGRRLIGQGSQVTATGLSAGKPRIRLVATDSRGRHSAVTVRPTLTAVKPVLTALKQPKTVSRKARTVKLRVAANVPATLRAGAKRFKVGPRTSVVTVALPRKGKRITLRLMLGRGSLSSTTQVVLTRR